jgi:hypothetical protein
MPGAAKPWMCAAFSGEVRPPNEIQYFTWLASVSITK